MRGTRAARRYAGALLQLASEMKKSEEVASDMQFIHDSIAASHDLKLFFESPIIDRFKKRDVARVLFEGKVNELTLHFVFLLVDKGREGLIYAISIDFAALLEELLGIVNAELRAPFEFEEKSKSDVQHKLEYLTNKKVRVSFSLDKSLVGGFLAQIGDTVYDGSVRRQLELLRRQFSGETLFQG